MKNALTRNFLIGFIFLCLTSLSYGKTIHVPGDYPTIQAGINAATSGDTVQVAAGTYEEQIKPKSGVAILGEGADVTTITSLLKVVYAEFVTNAIIDGFTIDGQGTDVESIYCSNSSLTISNNVITKNNAGVGIYCTDWSNLTISNNTITKHNIGIKCSSANPIIKGNTITENTQGIYCRFSAPTINNNSIADNGDYGIFCEECEETSLIISSNTITGNGQGIRCRFSSPTISENNITGNGDGIRCVDSSKPIIKDNTITNNKRLGIACDGSAPWGSSPTISGNIITHNTYYGISCSGDSNPDIGGGHQGSPGQNSIFSNGSPPLADYCDLLNKSPNTIKAENNWWGKSPPDAIQFIGNVDYDPWLTKPSYDGPIWYVSTTGDDVTGDGSETNPFRTIQKGIDAASDGHTVLVADGIYKGDGNNKLSFMGKAITVASANGPESTIIDCERNGRAFQFASNETSASVVSGFTIRSGFDDYGGGIYCHQSSPTIENNIIVGNSAKTNGGGIWLNYSSSIIKNNIITENSAGGIGGGIYCYWVPSPTIQNNVITGNSAVMKGGGIYCDNSSPTIQNNEINQNSADYGGGIYNSNFSSPSPTIQNNKIRGNLAGAGGGGIYCNGSSPTVQNNEISGNSADYGGGISCYESSPMIINNTISRNSSSNPRDPAGGIASWFYSRPKVFNTILWADTPNEVNVDAQSNITITYSDIQGGWEGEGNINADPMFVNPENGDYHLQAGSPCINAGTPEGAPSDDIEGNPRDANPDMGAYEYVAPPDTTPPTPNTIASIVAISSTQIDLTSTEATDDTPPVYYRIDGQFYDSSTWTDSGGGVSDYDYSTTRPNPWSDTNLVENGWYRYRQQLKDSATPPNESAWSDWVNKATLLNPPQDAKITFSNLMTTSMDVTVAPPPKPSGTGSTGAYFDLFTGEGKGSGVTDRGYADDYTAEYVNLNPNTQYGWRVKYRNRDGVETVYNPTEQKRYTLANTPSAPTVSNPTSTTLDVTINPNGNPDYTLFAIYNVTGGYYVNASGGSNGDTEVWQTKGDWGTVTVVNLTPETTYEFKCKAKNGDGVETPLGPSGSGTTKASPVFPIKILPESQTIKVGETAAINIQIENVTDFGGFEFKLRYKTNIIEIKESDIQAGVFLTSTGKQVINANPKFSTEGDETVLFYGAATYGDQPPPSGTGILATIALKGIGAGTTTLDLFEVQVGDANANPISVDAIDGSITVESILYGDVSDNGFITAYDASLVLQYVVGLIELSPEQQKAADVTNNGTISALDAALILQYTVGLITKFPVDSAPIAPALNPPNETNLLTKAIEQLEKLPLTEEQKQVLEQLKNLVFSQLIPKHTALFQSFPNPFNPETWIPFKLASDSLVVIDIYDIKGKLVRRLDLGRKEAGCYLDKLTAARWNGCSQTGERVASGIYLYTIKAGKFTATRRMVVVK